MKYAELLSWFSENIDYDKLKDYSVQFQVPYMPDVVEYEIRYVEIDNENKTILLKFED